MVTCCKALSRSSSKVELDDWGDGVVLEGVGGVVGGDAFVSIEGRVEVLGDEDGTTVGGYSVFKLASEERVIGVGVEGRFEWDVAK